MEDRQEKTRITTNVFKSDLDKLKKISEKRDYSLSHLNRITIRNFLNENYETLIKGEN